MREILICYCILLDSQKPLTGALRCTVLRPVALGHSTACTEAPYRGTHLRAQLCGLSLLGAAASRPAPELATDHMHPTPVNLSHARSRRAGRRVRALPGHPVWLQDRHVLRGGKCTSQDVQSTEPERGSWGVLVWQSSKALPSGALCTTGAWEGGPGAGSTSKSPPGSDSNAGATRHPLPQALPAILKWGLAAEDKAGALTAVPLPKALQRLDEVFDNIYSFSVSH